MRLIAELRQHHDSEWTAITSVTAKLGVGTAKTVRKWARRAEIDTGVRPGVTSQDAAQLREAARGGLGAAACERYLKGGVGFYADLAVMSTVGRVGEGRGCSGRVAAGETVGIIAVL